MVGGKCEVGSGKWVVGVLVGEILHDARWDGAVGDWELGGNKNWSPWEIVSRLQDRQLSITERKVRPDELACSCRGKLQGSAQQGNTPARIELHSLKQ